jgi:hypothetical protein
MMKFRQLTSDEIEFVKKILIREHPSSDASVDSLSNLQIAVTSDREDKFTVVLLRFPTQIISVGAAKRITYVRGDQPDNGIGKNVALARAVRREMSLVDASV